MYKRITKSLSHPIPINSALRLHFSRRNERVPAEVRPVVSFAGTPVASHFSRLRRRTRDFAGTPVAFAISVRLRLCPPKPSASLHPGASRHPFTWPWAAMGSGGHSLQPSSFRFDCTLSRLSATAEAGMKRSGIDRPGAAGVIRGQSPRKSALSSPRTRLAEATAVRALATVATTTSSLALSPSPPSPPRRHRHRHCITAIPLPFSPIALKKATAAKEVKL